VKARRQTRGNSRTRHSPGVLGCCVGLDGWGLSGVASRRLSSSCRAMSARVPGGTPGDVNPLRARRSFVGWDPRRLLTPRPGAGLGAGFNLANRRLVQLVTPEGLGHRDQGLLREPASQVALEAAHVGLPPPVKPASVRVIRRSDNPSNLKYAKRTRLTSNSSVYTLVQVNDKNRGSLRRWFHGSWGSWRRRLCWAGARKRFVGGASGTRGLRRSRSVGGSAIWKTS
jgi:hypothetical protein